MNRLIALLAVCIIACDQVPSAPVQTGDVNPNLRLLNATTIPLDVEVDGQIVLAGLAASMASPSLNLEFGTHLIRLRPQDGAFVVTEISVTVSTSGGSNAIAYQNGSSVAAQVLADTGANVPAGKSKLRVVHLAPSAPELDIWRTQPDYQIATRILFPFTFNPEPYNYVQSDAGAWVVWITPVTNSASTIATTGPIDIPSGQRRTVALVDSAGVLRLRVLEE